MANELFSEVARLTGLPSEFAEQEIAGLLEKQGVAPEDVTLDSLRAAALAYLETVAAEIEAEEARLNLAAQGAAGKSEAIVFDAKSTAFSESDSGPETNEELAQ